MSLHETEIISLLKSHTGFNCFLDVVPDSVELPALALTNIGNDQMSTRVLSGRKTGRSSDHRISLICNTMDELDQLVNSIELLDNTTNDYFQRTTVDLSNREARQEGSNVVRAFYNLTVIKK